MEVILFTSVLSINVIKKNEGCTICNSIKDLLNIFYSSMLLCHFLLYALLIALFFQVLPYVVIAVEQAISNRQVNYKMVLGYTPETWLFKNHFHISWYVVFLKSYKICILTFHITFFYIISKICIVFYQDKVLHTHDTLTQWRNSK